MKLSYRLFKSNKVFVEDYVNNICSICLDIINSDKMITSCSHCFHTDCLSKALNITPKCPYCRSTITKLNYKIVIGLNWKKQCKNIKRTLERFTEYLVENHCLLSVTIALPFLYLAVLFCILYYIYEKISNLFVNNNNNNDEDVEDYSL